MKLSPLFVLREIMQSEVLITKSEKYKLALVAMAQMFLAFLDLAGVALFGVLGAIAANGLTSSGPGDRVVLVLQFLKLENFEFRTQVLLISFIACFLLILKTILSLTFNRRALFFLSRRAALVSARLVKKFLSQQITSVQKNSVHENVFAVTSGVASLTTGVIGVTLNMASDLFLLFIIGSGLFVIDKIMAITVILLFSGVSFVLYFILHQRAENLGQKSSQLNIKSDESIHEILVAFREAVVRNRVSHYAELIGKQRIMLANVSAEYAFLPSISKYVLEIFLVISALVMGFVQFTTNDTGTLVLFLAGSYRIAPAILRIQQNVITMRTHIGIAIPTLNLIRKLTESGDLLEPNNVQGFLHENFLAKIELKSVNFTYPNKDNLVLNDINFSIESGEFVAVVGPSGSGKSTLVDVCLGILKPNHGSILLSGLKPSEALNLWPGAVGYVPQDVTIFNTSIKMNIGLGFSESEIDLTRIHEAIKQSQSLDFISKLTDGIESNVGDRGTRLSGGQRQRLGIARALYTNPKLLVLDEATSSLDGVTEANITEEILRLKGQVTLIIVAHRLSTIKAADRVIYLDNGRILSVGNFDEVRSSVPDFDHQAKLMGLI